MAVGRHYHSSVATLSSLGAAMTAAQTTIVVPQATFLGYPASYPFTVRIEGGTANEELVDITSLASGPTNGLLTFNCDRGASLGWTGASGPAAGSTVLDQNQIAKAHAINAVVDHPVTARDLEEAGLHVVTAAGVHGIAAGESVLGSSSVPWSTWQTGLAKPAFPGSNLTASVTVTFAPAFSAVPHVLITGRWLTDNTITTFAYTGLSATGFTIKATMPSGTAPSAGITCDCQWIAYL